MRQENVNNMPETSSETETEERMTDRQQRDQGNRSTHNVVSLMSQFADDNLTLVRVGGCFVWPATDWWCMGMNVQYGHFVAIEYVIHLHLHLMLKLAAAYLLVKERERHIHHADLISSCQASAVVPSGVFDAPCVTIISVKVFLTVIVQHMFSWVVTVILSTLNPSLLSSSLTQNISTGLAVAGVIVIARSIKLVRAGCTRWGKGTLKCWYNYRLSHSNGCTCWV